MGGGQGAEYQVDQIKLADEAVKTTLNDQVGWWGVCGRGHLGVSFLRRSMCAKGMGCERRWVRWVLRGTETVSGHPRIVTVIA